jgi:hypothetical protein
MNFGVLLSKGVVWEFVFLVSLTMGRIGPASWDEGWESKREDQGLNPGRLFTRTLRIRIGHHGSRYDSIHIFGGFFPFIARDFSAYVAPIHPSSSQDRPTILESAIAELTPFNFE